MRSTASKIMSILTVSSMILASVSVTANAASVSGTLTSSSGITSPPDKPDGDSTGGSSSTPTSWDADLTYTSSDNNTASTAYSPSVSSSAADYNAILNNGGTIWLKDVTASRTGSSSTGGDNASFYGIGATLLTVDGTTYIDGATINSTDKGGAGIFSYNSGITYVRNATINTTANTAGGIHAAGGGTLYAYNVNATSAGQSSAALRSDRGGGTMVVEGGSYTSNGTRSPSVYCTADITVADSILTATKSEAVCIEGLNSLALFDCQLSGDAPSETENSGLTWGIILYQSMSGDSSVGNSSFYMDGGTLDCTANGTYSTLFFNTNTESTITLNNVDIDTSADYDYFLLVSGFSRWGSTGSNGADCLFTAIDQDINGNIGWDSISDVDLYLTDGSVMTGAVVNDNTFGQTSSGSGYCNVYVDADSDWICTGDSTVSNLYNAGGSIVDASGNTVTIKANGSTVVSGTSSYTITVTGTYSTSDNTSGAETASSYSYTPYTTWNPWSDTASATATTTSTNDTAATTTTVSSSASTTTVTSATTTISSDSTAETTTTSSSSSDTSGTTPPPPPEWSSTTTTTGDSSDATQTTPPPPPEWSSTTTTSDSAETTTTTTVSDGDKLPYGDANDDGEVDVADAVLILQYLSAKDVYPISDDGLAKGDVSSRGDGITAADALAIQQYLADIVSALPVSYL